ncbi:MAG: hypothetical protein NVS2B14_16040 [Chamaesiphon sp.]
MLLLAIAGIVGLGILGLLAMGTYSWLHKTLKTFSIPVLEGEQPLVQLDRPPIPIPAPDTQVIALNTSLTEKAASEVIQTWLSTKVEALGQNHQVDRLGQILVDPALSHWQQFAQTVKKNNSYWAYKHSVQVKSVKTSDVSSDRASVEAIVNETAQLYEEGQPNQESYYNHNLQVKYDLVRKDGQWRIQEMNILN